MNKDVACAHNTESGCKPSNILVAYKKDIVFLLL